MSSRAFKVDRFDVCYSKDEEVIRWTGLAILQEFVVSALISPLRCVETL